MHALVILYNSGIQYFKMILEVASNLYFYWKYTDVMFTCWKRMQVRLIGYSVESSLFLVYEFIENGNLSEHLRGSSGENQKFINRTKKNYLLFKSYGFITYIIN